MSLFHPSTDFSALFAELKNYGYYAEDLQLIMSDNARKRYFNSDKTPDVNVELNDKASEGFTTGAISGGLIGAIIGGLTLSGSLLIPGSQILLLGPAVGGISGALAGSATGGIIGALVGMGIPEVEAKFFNESVNDNDNVLVVVNAREDNADDVADLLNRFDAKKTSTI